MDTNKTFNISMPKNLLDAVDKQAEIEFRNRSDLIREAVRTYIVQKGGMSVNNKLTKTEVSRIVDSLNFAGLHSEPAVILSCTFRPQPNTVKDIFATDSKAIQLIERPPKLREMGGWGLDTLDRARPVASEYLEVSNGEKKILRLFRDGQHVLAAGINFLGHAVNNKEQSPSNFNLLAVAELIINFVSFSKELSKTLENNCRIMIFTIKISNPARIEEKIDPTLTLAAYDGFGVEKAGELNLELAERDIAINADDNISTNRVAYLIYSEFCYFFGARSDELWYVTKNQEINSELIKRGLR